ncbi:hypothetical protein [Salmonella phage SD-15_S21]|nr:hypothetical protein [Salmonella phage SD-15_S21]
MFLCVYNSKGTDRSQSLFQLFLNFFWVAICDSVRVHLFNVIPCLVNIVTT